MNESKDSENFQWKDFIEKKKSTLECFIKDFIVYQKPGQKTTEYVIKNFDKSKEQNLEMLNLIRDILKSTAELTPKQVIDYCNSQRYFMKLYFKKLQNKLK